MGSGPLAACDMHMLNVETMRWSTSPDYAPPGPCNMHTADYVPEMDCLFIFRGGDGREYLNSLHRLNLKSMEWSTPTVQGDPPLPRANHSSSVVRQKLYIFGGWDGNKRLNDIHILDAQSMVWSSPTINGRPPSPRAGMTFTQVRDRIFLFGGSGPSAKCFNDLQIFDPERLLWLNIATPEDLQKELASAKGAGGAGGEGGGGGEEDSGGTKDHGSGLNAGFDNLGMSPFASKYSELGDDELTTITTTSSGQVNGSPTSPERSSSGIDGGLGGSAISDEEGVINTFQGRPLDDVVTFLDTQVVQDGSNPNAFFDYNDDKNVLIQGNGPGHRAGHTTTVVDERRLFVFGGSYGTEYLNDFFILDTDPPPLVEVIQPSSMSLLSRSLGRFCNDEEFSDVEFLVEGRVIHAHRVILSMLSERFRAMFSSGFIESTQKQIRLDDIRYTTFMAMLEYLYSGKGPEIEHNDDNSSLLKIIELLRLSDQFMLDHLKQLCECRLQSAVSELNVDSILEHGAMFNADQLVQYCRHFKRNFCKGSTLSVEEEGEEESDQSWRERESARKK